MLVLSRRPQQSVIIILPDGRRVEVAVLRLQSGVVRIGIEAPSDIAIVRDELSPRPPLGRHLAAAAQRRPVSITHGGPAA